MNLNKTLFALVLCALSLSATASEQTDCSAAAGAFLTGTVTSSPRYASGSYIQGVQISHTHVNLTADQDGLSYDVAMDNVFAYDYVQGSSSMPASLAAIKIGDRLELCGEKYTSGVGIHWVHTNCGATPTTTAPNGWVKEIASNGSVGSNLEASQNYCYLWGTSGGTALATTSPSNVTVAAGGTATFSVTASGGTSPYSYQWYRNGAAIAGASSASYSFTAQSTDNGATFYAKVTDSESAPVTVQSGTATLTVSSGGTMTERMTNGGFEASTVSPWTGTTGDIGNFSGETAYAGSKYAWMNGYGSATNETLSNAVTIPSSSTQATLSFALHVDTAETTTTGAYDKLTVTLKNSSGSVLKTIATFSNLNAASGYKVYSYDVSAYAGQTVYVTFNGVEDSSLQTSFVIDSVSLKSN